MTEKGEPAAANPGAQAAPCPPPLNLPVPAPAPDDTLVSPLLAEDGSVSFSLYAPRANKVLLDGAELIHSAANCVIDPHQPLALKNDGEGFWQIALRAPPGTYRYAFLVDGVRVVDPRNPLTANANAGVSSLLHVPGTNAIEDRLQVPHGAVCEIFYTSQVFGTTRRMHVYTPPGYERSNETYPVLYLLHGNGDSDQSWSSVGRANFILDNLIASGSARPMIVVMPAGHWPTQTSVLEVLTSPSPGHDPFSRDFVEAMVPHIESRYRVCPQARSRAIAGLSMGGLQALTLALTQPNQFGYVGLFSTGFLLDAHRAYRPEQLAASRAFELLYCAFGSDDFIAPYSRYTVALLAYYGVKVLRRETDGGHTWINWRAYLADFAPRLFVET